MTKGPRKPPLHAKRNVKDPHREGPSRTRAPSGEKRSKGRRVALRVPFQVFEHTADIGLDVEAENLDALFADTARGLFQVVRGDNPVEPAARFQVETESDTLVRLLVRFLNEFVFLMDSESVVFHDVESVHLEAKDGVWHVRAEVTGEPFSHEKHPGCLHVKAATRHDARVDHEGGDGKAHARVILDV